MLAFQCSRDGRPEGSHAVCSQVLGREYRRMYSAENKLAEREGFGTLSTKWNPQVADSSLLRMPYSPAKLRRIAGIARWKRTPPCVWSHQLCESAAGSSVTTKGQPLSWDQAAPAVLMLRL